MKLLLLLLLVTCRLASAQALLSLTGSVTDKATGAALPYASIQLVGSRLGTTTNQAGEFVFRVPAATGHQVVVFSYLGYQSVTLTWPAAGLPRVTVALEPRAVRLHEVVVQPITVLDLVVRCLEKVPQNYAVAPYQAEGFQREVVRANQDVIQLLEAAFHTTGRPQNQTTTVLDGRYLEDKRAKAPLWNPARGGFYTFGWTAVSGIDAPDPRWFLGVKLKRVRDLARYYTFDLRPTTMLNGKPVHVIDFNPKKQIRQPLLQGTLYLDAASDALVRAEHWVSPHGVRFLRAHHTWGGQMISQSPKQVTVQQDRWTTTYQQVGTKWYLRSVVIDTDFSAALLLLGQTLGRRDSLHLHSERVVTSIDTTQAAPTGKGINIAEVGRFSTLQNFIRQQYEDRDPNWATHNYLPLDPALADLAQQLRSKNDQWAAALGQRTQQRYTARQLHKDVVYAQQSLQKLHPALYKYTDPASLDRAFGDVKKQLTKPASEAELLRLLSPVIEQIHCGHTELYPSEATEQHQARVAKPFPMDLWLNGEQAVVSRAYAGIPQGATVVAVNGHELGMVLPRLRALIPADGYNQTYKQFRLQHDFARLFARHVQAADSFTIVYQEPGQQARRTARVAGRERAAPPNCALARIDENLRTMVLTIPSFAPDQDFPAFLEQAFRALAAQRLESLVLDLRGNAGGRDDYAALLYSYLARAPFRVYNRITVPTTDRAWLNRLTVAGVSLLTAVPDYLAGLQPTGAGFAYTNHPGLQAQKPQPNAFQGPVYVLVDGGTFSAAADFAALVRSHQRGEFIGEEVGGGYYGNASLGTAQLTLPHSKLRLILPLAWFDSSVSAQGAAAGHGVVPEHAVRYELADVLAGRDQALAVCLELLRKARK